ncbi:MAG: hypothetical protein JO129_02245 [Candidatus Dependentiae bacterium]|nr:hypothetical protein [Candidatus Dependentiae bacterium]
MKNLLHFLTLCSLLIIHNDVQGNNEPQNIKQSENQISTFDSVKKLLLSYITYAQTYIPTLPSMPTLPRLNFNNIFLRADQPIDIEKVKKSIENLLEQLDNEAAEPQNIAHLNNQNLYIKSLENIVEKAYKNACELCIKEKSTCIAAFEKEFLQINKNLSENIQICEKELSDSISAYEREITNTIEIFNNKIATLEKQYLKDKSGLLKTTPPQNILEELQQNYKFELERLQEDKANKIQELEQQNAIKIATSQAIKNEKIKTFQDDAKNQISALEEIKNNKLHELAQKEKQISIDFAAIQNNLNDAITKFHDQCEQSLIYTQVTYLQHLEKIQAYEDATFDSIGKNKSYNESHSNSTISLFGLSRSYQYQYSADPKNIVCKGCINKDESINPIFQKKALEYAKDAGLQSPLAYELIGMIALELKATQAEDDYVHTLGVQKCKKNGTHIHCKTISDEYEKALNELNQKSAEKDSHLK